MPSALVEKNGSSARLQDLGRHPFAVVDDAETHVVSGAHIFPSLRLLEGHVARRYRHLAAVRQRVAGIRREIEQRIVEFAGVGDAHPQVVGEIELQRDLRAERGFDELGEASNPVVDGERRDLEPASSAQRQEPAIERRAGLGRLQRGLKEKPQALVADALVDQFEIADDHRQQIIEIVRDRGGEASHGLHAPRVGPIPPRPVCARRGW